MLGITISRKQFEYAQRMCTGLPVEIRLQDYREISESFDRIVSIGMFEHVDQRNYRRYIFPNSMLPSIRYISEAAEGLLVMEDWYNFGAHYDTTLLPFPESGLPGQGVHPR